MKPLSFLLFALVFGILLANVTQSFADPQLDSLLRIATQARDNIDIQLSQIQNVPEDITSLYQQGSSETDALAQSVAQGDFDSSKQHFLAAMKIFKEVNDKISSLSPTNEQSASQDTSRLKSEISRVQNIGESLQRIAIRNNVDINFTKFNELIQTTNQDLDGGNLDEVNKALQTANQFLLDVHHQLADVAKQRLSDRAKHFTEKEVERFDKLTQPAVNAIQPPNATQPLNPIQPPNATQPLNPIQPPNVHEMVAELKQLVSEGKIDQAIQMIKAIEAAENGQAHPEPILNENTSGAPTTNETTNSTLSNTVINSPTGKNTTYLQLPPNVNSNSSQTSNVTANVLPTHNSNNYSSQGEYNNTNQKKNDSQDTSPHSKENHDNNYQ